MQPQIRKEFLEDRFQFKPVRCPIQCEGIERGHRRIAEVAVSGSVNPQWDLSDVWGAAKTFLPYLYS